MEICTEFAFSKIQITVAAALQVWKVIVFMILAHYDALIVLYSSSPAAERAMINLTLAISFWNIHIIINQSVV